MNSFAAQKARIPCARCFSVRPWEQVLRAVLNSYIYSDFMCYISDALYKSDMLYISDVLYKSDMLYISDVLYKSYMLYISDVLYISVNVDSIQ